MDAKSKQNQSKQTKGLTVKTSVKVGPTTDWGGDGSPNHNETLL